MEEQVIQYEVKNNILIAQVMASRLYQNINPVFREELRDLHQRYESLPVILNLKNVDVINSSGIGVLIMFSDLMNKKNIRFIVVGLKPLLKELFERMRLETIFTILESESDGMEELSK